MKNKAFRYVCAVVLSLTLALVPLGIVSFAQGGSAYGVLDFVPTDDGSGYWLDADGNVVDGSAYPYDGKLRASAAADLPSAYDSRDLGIITPVKDQYGSGNCWTFAALGALEANAVKKGILSYADADFSEAQFVWFSANPVAADPDDPAGRDGKNIGGDCYETGGNWMDIQSAIARGSGAAADADYPFSRNLSVMGDYDESARYDHSKATVANIEKIDSFMGELPSTLNAEIKQAVMNYGSVIVAFYVDQSYGFNGASYFKSDAEGTNHEVLIVGWDDDYARTNFNADDMPDNNGAWLCKNSWGTGSYHSDGGYFWISYEEPTLRNFVALEAAPGDDYSAIYQYDGNGCYGTAFSESSDMFGANVYTAGADEYVSKIGFYARGGNMNCTVRVYTDLTGDTPDTGVLAAEETFTEKYVGYKTYDLESVVEVSEGEKFAVAIQTEYDGSYFVPVEGRINTVNGLEFVCEEKQSYVYRDGAWVDQASAGSDGTHNVCVKALNVASAAHEHRYEEYVLTEPTCTAEGSKETKCTLCGDSLGVSPIDALGHTASEDWERTVDPTCTAAGEEVKKCAVCGDVLETREVAATGHTPGGIAVISSPTCVAEGEKVIRCRVCGDVVERIVTPVSPNAHTYSTWAVTSEGDCLTKGQKTRVCQLCGYEDVKDTTYGDHADNDGDGVCDICEEEIDPASSEGSENERPDGGGFGLQNFLARLKAFIERIIKVFKDTFSK